MSRALIVVDMQVDFVHVDGALYVPGSTQLASLINQHVEKQWYDIYVFTRDWHPHDSPTFREFGGLWPAHCIAGTYGAEFTPSLDPSLSLATMVLSKDQNDAFYYSWSRSTGLHEFLRANWIDTIDICGVALDYCVKETAVSAACLGYGVTVLRDLCIPVAKETGEAAIKQIRQEGGIVA